MTETDLSMNATYADQRSLLTFMLTRVREVSGGDPLLDALAFCFSDGVARVPVLVAGGRVVENYMRLPPGVPVLVARSGRGDVWLGHGSVTQFTKLSFVPDYTSSVDAVERLAETLLPSPLHWITERYPSGRSRGLFVCGGELDGNVYATTPPLALLGSLVRKMLIKP